MKQKWDQSIAVNTYSVYLDEINFTKIWMKIILGVSSS